MGVVSAMRWPAIGRAQQQAMSWGYRRPEMLGEAQQASVEIRILNRVVYVRNGEFSFRTFQISARTIQEGYSTHFGDVSNCSFSFQCLILF